MTKRLSFSHAELVELWRALDLIAIEDDYAGVNMDAASVAAKASAKAKLDRALGRKTKERA